MIDVAFSSLVSAWRVSLVASMLLFTALAIAPIWDTAVYVKALNEALMMDHF
jgi:hypothetical protein